MGKNKDKVSKKGKNENDIEKINVEPYKSSVFLQKKETPQLCDALTWGLLQFPELFEDLPLIMTGLDSSQIINPDNMINKKMGLYLSRFFEYLPLKYLERQGFCKDKNNPTTSMSGYILNELLISKSIMQPSQLIFSQLLSSRYATSLLKSMIVKYPELLNDVPSILDSLAGGDVIQLGGIENKEMKEFLGEFLDSLEVKRNNNVSNNENEENDDINDSRSVSKKNQVLKDTLVEMAGVFRSAEKFSSLRNNMSSSIFSSSLSLISLQSETNAIKRDKQAVEDICADSNYETCDKKNEENDERASESSSNCKFGPSIGPSLPSSGQLAAAQAATKVVMTIQSYLHVCVPVINIMVVIHKK